MKKKKVLALVMGGLLTSSVLYAASYEFVATSSTNVGAPDKSDNFSKEALAWFQTNSNIKYDNITVDNLTTKGVITGSGSMKIEFVLSDGKFKSGPTYSLVNTNGGGNLDTNCDLLNSGTTLECLFNGSVDNVTLKSSSSTDNITFIPTSSTNPIKLAVKVYEYIGSSWDKKNLDNFSTVATPAKWISLGFGSSEVKATIDVNEGRAKFVTFNNDQSDNTTLTLSFNSAVNYKPNTGTYTITLTGATPAGFIYQADNNSGAGVSLDNFTSSNTYQLTESLGQNYNSYVKIHPVSAMNPGVYEVTADFSSNVSGLSVTADNSTKFNLDINGAQLRAPYLFNNSLSWIRITNTSDMSAEITADVYDEAGNKVTNINMGTVAGKSSKVIYANEIINAAKNKSGTPSNFAENGRFTAEFIVAAPSKNVSAVSVVKITSSGSERFFPVFKFIGGEYQQ